MEHMISNTVVYYARGLLSETPLSPRDYTVFSTAYNQGIRGVIIVISLHDNVNQIFFRDA